MMARRGGRTDPAGREPSQRQLRAGELIRHALIDILAREELRDPALQGVSITIGEVRCSPDLKHAKVFCSPLGETEAAAAEALAEGLNRAARFLRGRLGREIEMKFTPALHFVADTSYNAAAEMDRLLDRPDVQKDLD